MSDVPRNRALDGIRGYAALVVALGHLVLHSTGLDIYATTVFDFPSMTTSNIIARLLLAIFPQDAAVSVFFVLSGYVLYSSFAKGSGKGILDFPDYILARIFRLFPLIVVTGLLIGLITAQNATALELAKNMILLSKSLNGTLWSLQVEVICSGLIFVVWLFAGKSAIRLIICLVVTLILQKVHFIRVIFFVPLFFFPAFCLGALITKIPRPIWESRLLFATGLALLILPALVVGRTSPFARYTDILGSFLVVGYVGTIQPRLTINVIAQFLGAVSYLFYLSHILFIAMAAWVIPVTPEALFLNILSIGLASIPIALIWSWIMHIFIEMPAINGRPRIVIGRAVGKAA